MADWISKYFKADVVRGTINPRVSGTTTYLLLVDDTTELTAGIEFLGDITAISIGEISVTGYTPGHGEAGRKLVTDITHTFISTTTSKWDATDATFGILASGATINGAILHFKGSANDTTAKIIAFYDLTNTATNGGTVTVQWAATGILNTGGD